MLPGLSEAGGVGHTLLVFKGISTAYCIVVLNAVEIVEPLSISLPRRTFMSERNTSSMNDARLDYERLQDLIMCDEYR